MFSKLEDFNGQLDGYQEGGAPGEQPTFFAPHKWSVPLDTGKRLNDYKVYFGIKNSKMKTNDAANELLEEIKIDGPTGTDMQTEHACAPQLICRSFSCTLLCVARFYHWEEVPTNQQLDFQGEEQGNV